VTSKPSSLIRRRIAGDGGPARRDPHDPSLGIPSPASVAYADLDSTVEPR